MWHVPVILALGRLKQEDYEFKGQHGLQSKTLFLFFWELWVEVRALLGRHLVLESCPKPCIGYF
jgi:hypothetical protein